MATAGSRPAKFPRVPYGAIRTFVGNLHVATPDSMVRRNWERRCLVARKRGSDITPAEEREIVRFALWCHRDNRETYRRVMGGLL